jgi:hypothetical protein
MRLLSRLRTVREGLLDFFGKQTWLIPDIEQPRYFER